MLCVSGELFGLAMSLLNVHKPSMTLLVDRTKQIRNYAALAMAFIIILLKLLLGLDDSTERYVQIRNYAAFAMAFIIILLKLLLGLDDSTERYVQYLHQSDLDSLETLHSLWPLSSYCSNS